MSDSKTTFFLIMLLVIGFVFGCCADRSFTHMDLKKGDSIHYFKDLGNTFESQNYKCQEITK